ncbi:MAG: TIGR00730 family Rossman fold protein [Verrucomicrobia bacterium]|nr:TIGR00730 family Rossman fold protein [Verrucomicrobiota bacterium]
MFGAGRTGCMGALNDACLKAGGRIEGVILQKFVDDNLHHSHLHEMIVVDTMRERKRLLAKDINGFIALPGGPGTWEELWEIAVERQIGSHQVPLIIINYQGYYDGIRQQLLRAEKDLMLYGPASDLMTFVDDSTSAIDGNGPNLWFQPISIKERSKWLFCRDTQGYRNMVR